MGILVVGSVALDTVKTPFAEVKEALGGSATHFAFSARHYTPVSMVAVVGEDFPKKHLALLKRKGIDTRGLEIRKGKTFRWQGYYEYDLNQAHTRKTQLNVFSTFQPKIIEEYRKIKYLFLANIDPRLQLSVLRQVKRPKLVLCDTMNYWIERKRKDLLRIMKEVDILLLNDAEARELTGEHNLFKAARAILKMGPEMTIIKKGEHGALMWSKDSHFTAPGYPLEDICDPTGAGDSFAGGFLGFLAYTDSLSQENIKKAVIFGSVMASYNVEDFSTRRLERLKEKEIIGRYEEFKKMTYFEDLNKEGLE
jgi:sugar/nucleoside kinase (ribokinase family)